MHQVVAPTTAATDSCHPDGVPGYRDLGPVPKIRNPETGICHDRLDRLEQRANRRRIFTGFSRFLRMESVRLRYHLEHNIDPNQMTGPAMARAFALVASALLLPLLITVLASDLVTGENSAGTIKMLLTRPVARWKIRG
jgi:ABC-type transport system involved in multi-copper enzyme maturation permease subunit